MSFKALITLIIIITVGLIKDANAQPPSDILILNDLNSIRSSIINNSKTDTNRIKISEEILSSFPNYLSSFSDLDIEIKLFEGFFIDTTSLQSIALIKPNNENLPVERFYWKEKYCILFLYDYNKKSKSWELKSVQPFYNNFDLIRIAKNSKLNNLVVNNDNCIQGNCRWLWALYSFSKDGILNELLLKTSFDKTMYIESQLKDSTFYNEFERVDVYQPGDTISYYSYFDFTDEDKDNVNELKEEVIVNIFQGIKDDKFTYLTSREIIVYKLKSHSYQRTNVELGEKKEEFIRKEY